MNGLRFERVSVKVGAFTLGPIETCAPAGCITAVLGPNGCGKTTLLRVAMGLLRPQSGSVRLGDMIVTARPEAERAACMAFVPQRPAAPPGLCVEEVVAIGRLRLPRDPVAIEIAMRRAGVWERRHEPVETLSEGQRHRVAIVRALAQCHRFIFADEPTASLDAARRGVVMDLLLDYTQSQGASLVMVTHDTELMPRFPNQARVEDFTA